MGRRKHARPRRAWRQRSRSLIVMALAAAAFAIVAWTAYRPDPAKLLREATSYAARDPAQAEQLLHRAIAVAGGRFPDAEMLLCRLAARRGDWETALPLFTALDLSACQAGFLLEFGKLALESGRSAEAVRALTEVRHRRVPESVVALDQLFTYYRNENDERRMLDCVR